MVSMEDGFDIFYNEFKDWTKEQLLHRIYDIILQDTEEIGEKDNEIEQLNKSLDVATETINNKQKTIVRLSSIVNGYEKIKKELLDYIYHNEYCRFGHIDDGEADAMRSIINKIDRLKEGEYSEK